MAEEESKVKAMEARLGATRQTPITRDFDSSDLGKTIRAAEEAVEIAKRELRQARGEPESTPQVATTARRAKAAVGKMVADWEEEE